MKRPAPGFAAGVWFWMVASVGALAAEGESGCEGWMRKHLNPPDRDESALLAWIPGEGDCLPEQEHEILTAQGLLFLREGLNDLAAAAWLASLERPGPHREENLKRLQALGSPDGMEKAGDEDFTAWLTGRDRVSAQDPLLWKESLGNAARPASAPGAWSLRSAHAFSFAEQPDYRRSGFHHHLTLGWEIPWPWKAARPSLEGRGRLGHTLQPLGWEGWQTTAAAILPLGSWFLDGEIGGGWDEASGGNEPDLRQSGPFAPGWLGLVFGLHGLWLPRAEWRGWQGWIWGGLDRFREGWGAWVVTGSLQKKWGAGVMAGIFGYEDHRLKSVDMGPASLAGFSVWSAEGEWMVKGSGWNLALRGGTRLHFDRWTSGAPEAGFSAGTPPAGRQSAEGGMTLKLPGRGAWSWEGAVRGGYEWSGRQGGPMAGARLRLRFREDFR